MAQHPSSANIYWRKSSRSQEHGACVELASLPGIVAVRDSKDPVGPTLTFDHSSWQTFIQRLKKSPNGGL